jgi:hypothetical protein
MTGRARLASGGPRLRATAIGDGLGRPPEAA